MSRTIRPAPLPARVLLAGVLPAFVLLAGLAGCSSTRVPHVAAHDPVAVRVMATPDYPTTAALVARQLAGAERVIAQPTTTGTALSRAAHLEQLALHAWSAHPRWDARVLAGLPASRRADARDNVTARRLFRSMHPAQVSNLATELPAWRIVKPWSRARLMRAYREAQHRYGVGWNYLAAVNMTESAFGRIVGLSTAGAQGPMQFMPATWAAYGHGDIRNPHDAILGAAHYLAANGFRSDPAGALWHYNQSRAYVRGVTLVARIMHRHPRAYAGFHAWQVYYLTTQGSVLLPVGYDEPRPVPVRTWIRRHHATVLP